MTIQEIKLDFRIVFQSTSPVGGMTESGEVPEWLKGISIHIPRGGDDPNLGVSVQPDYYKISIHIPRGGG